MRLFWKKENENVVRYKGKPYENLRYEIKEKITDGEAVVTDRENQETAHALYELREIKGEKLVYLSSLKVFSESNRRKRMGTELMIWLLEKYGRDRTVYTWAQSEDRNAGAQGALTRFYRNFAYGKDAGKCVLLDGIDLNGTGLTLEEEEEIFSSMLNKG